MSVDIKYARNESKLESIKVSSISIQYLIWKMKELGKFIKN